MKPQAVAIVNPPKVKGNDGGALESSIYASLKIGEISKSWEVVQEHAPHVSKDMGSKISLEEAFCEENKINSKQTVLKATGEEVKTFELCHEVLEINQGLDNISGLEFEENSEFFQEGEIVYQAANVSFAPSQ